MRKSDFLLRTELHHPDFALPGKGDLSEVDVSELEDVVADAEEESTGSFAWSKYPGAE